MSNLPFPLWASNVGRFSVDTKPTGTYTTTDEDFRKYIRVDDAVTLHSVDTDQVGEPIWIRNTDGLLSINISGDGGVTVNGMGTLSANSMAVAVVIGENEWDINLL